jgi:hypothetical protein
MVSSGGDKVNLRIRFAGLCLFVPRPDRGQTHVLMPPTADHECGHCVEAHEQFIYWVHGQQGHSASLSGRHLTLRGDGWEPADTEVRGVFDLADFEPVSGGAPHPHARVDVDTAPAAASLVLRAGKSRIVNPGARWRVARAGRSEVYPMPTVLDWWVHDVERSELDEALAEWDVFGSRFPEPNTRNTVDLWVLHTPREDQRPGQIGSTPDPGATPGEHHFTAYYSLLTRGAPDVALSDPVLQEDPGDWQPPEWPASVSAFGMLVTCMLARA